MPKEASRAPVVSSLAAGDCQLEQTLAERYVAAGQSCRFVCADLTDTTCVVTTAPLAAYDNAEAIIAAVDEVFLSPQFEYLGEPITEKRGKTNPFRGRGPFHFGGRLGGDGVRQGRCRQEQKGKHKGQSHWKPHYETRWYHEGI